jgi:hypothetical protein
MDAAAPYERLVRMIEHELELAGEGRVEELLAAVVARGEFMATLASPAPAAARGAVERANALHSRVIIETVRVRDSLERSFGSLRRARRMAGTYAPAPPGRYSTSV